MAKNNASNKIVNEEPAVPIKPAFDSYRVPFVTSPSSFMMYGENALHEFNAEVKRVEAEIRRELYGQEKQFDEPIVKKKVNATSIITVIISVLTIVLLTLGKYFNLTFSISFFNISQEKGTEGIVLIINLIEKIGTGEFDIASLLPNLGIALTALFAVITLIVSLFTLKKSGTGIFMKVCLFISFICAVFTAATLLVANQKINIVLYVILGLTFINTFVGFCSKKAMKRTIAEEENGTETYI